MPSADEVERGQSQSSAPPLAFRQSDRLLLISWFSTTTALPHGRALPSRPAMPLGRCSASRFDGMTASWTNATSAPRSRRYCHFEGLS